MTLKKYDTPLHECEIKFAKNNSGQFEGYASKFGGVDSYGDTIIQGAYKDTLEKGLPKMFYNHNSYDIPVGDWEKVEEDSTGLFVVGKIDMNHRDGPSLHSAMKRKAVDGLSIGYRIPPGGATENDHGGYDLIKVDLKEISPVNFPADTEARIFAVKSEIETIASLKDAELFLRDSGYSKSTAVAFVSRFKTLVRSDSDSGLQKEITMLRNRLSGQEALNSLVDVINKFNFEGK